MALADKALQIINGRVKHVPDANTLEVGAGISSTSGQTLTFTPSSGGIRVSIDGSAGTPAINLGASADLDTGWFHPAEDTIAMSTGGTEAIRIDSTQKVGIGTSSQNSTLHINGSLALPLVTKTANYTATVLDYTILADATSGAFSIFLPTAIGIAGRIYVIKKIDSSPNVVTVDPNSTQTIDGDLVRLLGSPYQTLVIQSNGSNWMVI
jgi:hypothetical protein